MNGGSTNAAAFRLHALIIQDLTASERHAFHNRQLADLSGWGKIVAAFDEACCSECTDEELFEYAAELFNWFLDPKRSAEAGRVATMQ